MNNHYHIQHLDIKPQNLFVVHNHVKVGDFGLAKLLEGVKATVTGGVTPVATTLAMAPCTEVACSNSKVFMRPGSLPPS